MRQDRLGVSVDLDARAAAGFINMYRTSMSVFNTHKKSLSEEPEFCYGAFKNFLNS